MWAACAMTQQLVPSVRHLAAAPAAASSGTAASPESAGLPCIACEVDQHPVIRLPPHHQLLLAEPLLSQPGMMLRVVATAASHDMQPACGVYLSHRNRTVQGPISPSGSLLQLHKQITSVSFDQATRLLLALRRISWQSCSCLTEHDHAGPRRLLRIKLEEEVKAEVQKVKCILPCLQPAASARTRCTVLVAL